MGKIRTATLNLGCVNFACTQTSRLRVEDLGFILESFQGCPHIRQQRMEGQGT